MKLNKLTLLATAATLLLGAYAAKAAIGTTMDYSKLTVKATVITNGATEYSGDKETTPTKKVKFGNKELLDLFAEWASDTWPKGAQLVIGWDAPWNGDVLVVDKSGTNVLFNADYQSYARFVVYFFNWYGAGSDVYLNADPGYYKVTAQFGAYVTLYDDDYFLDYTSLWAYGGNTQKFKQTWDENDDPKSWSDSESATFPYNGSQYFLDYGSETTFSATIKAKGSGKDYNYIGWAD